LRLSRGQDYAESPELKRLEPLYINIYIYICNVFGGLGGNRKRNATREQEQRTRRELNVGTAEREREHGTTTIQSDLRQLVWVRDALDDALSLTFKNGMHE